MPYRQKWLFPMLFGIENPFLASVFTHMIWIFLYRKWPFSLCHRKPKNHFPETVSHSHGFPVCRGWSDLRSTDVDLPTLEWGRHMVWNVTLSDRRDTTLNRRWSNVHPATSYRRNSIDPTTTPMRRRLSNVATTSELGRKDVGRWTQLKWRGDPPTSSQRRNPVATRSEQLPYRRLENVCRWLELRRPTDV